MILEESLIFNSEEEADLILKHLRDLGAAGKKIYRSTAFSEELVTCSIGGFIAWFSDLAMEESNTDPEGSGPALPGTYAFQRDLMIRISKKLHLLLDGKKPGDLIYTHEEARQGLLSLLGRVQAMHNDDSDHDTYDDTWVSITIIMKDNDLVEETPDGFLLKREIGDPGSLLYEIRSLSEEIAFRESGSAYNPVFSTHYYIEPECVVVTDPRLYFCDPHDSIIDDLEEMDVDLDSFDQFYENYQTKRNVLNAMVEVIGRAGSISIDELIREMKDYSHPPGGEEDGFSIDLDPQVTQMIVHELQKAKILTGPDRRIRLGKAMGQKP
ncbi:hypothetical protein RJ53_07605 [Methanocalculus chunghsingensis]|uniref:Uncharacterized protein n=1 Tax=Methanocalculus chunghsingensis TaxID=156457 RepID=A0A8J7W800_9EURY|nr:hypothetical protein [Methanocalculus chunghsingensis]MBR1369366.1 hypothetical protein [Methanocalculus chunghsingensis]